MNHALPLPPAQFGLRLPRPLLIALIGLPGAGKSSVATYLASRFQVRVVNRDRIRAAMFPECAYSLPEKRAAFQALMLAIEVNSALGESTIVDGMTFSRRSDLEKVSALAGRYGLTMVPIWLDIDPELARQRIAADIAAGQNSPLDRVPELVDSVLERFERPPPTVPVIDAGKAREQVFALAERVVQQRAGLLRSGS
ncbi:MAG: ATP-binding protein [Ahniella sp.]|nr:ATP-binding protein [Ahniella sp.]